MFYLGEGAYAGNQFNLVKPSLNNLSVVVAVLYIYRKL